MVAQGEERAQETGHEGLELVRGQAAHVREDDSPSGAGGRFARKGVRLAHSGPSHHLAVQDADNDVGQLVPVLGDELVPLQVQHHQLREGTGGR